MIERMSNLGLDPAEDLTDRARRSARVAGGRRPRAPRSRRASRDARRRREAEATKARAVGSRRRRRTTSRRGVQKIIFLGPYVCHDVALHARVVRCVGRHLAWARAAGDADATRVGERAVGEALIPRWDSSPPIRGARRTSCGTCSPRMPTTTRFRLYAEWKATHVESDGGFGDRRGPRAAVASRVRGGSRRRGVRREKDHAPVE